MYFEEAQLTGYNVLAILYCAKKYMISGLEKICREYLEKQINYSNVCFILEQVNTEPYRGGTDANNPPPPSLSLAMPRKRSRKATTLQHTLICCGIFF